MIVFKWRELNPVDQTGEVLVVGMAPVAGQTIRQSRSGSNAVCRRLRVSTACDAPGTYVLQA